ncbi:hypothetical protein IGI58_000965 [Enterococcus sp. AZ020]
MKISGAVLLRTTATGFAKADAEQYLATNGSEVTLLVNHEQESWNKPNKPELSSG